MSAEKDSDNNNNSTMDDSKNLSYTVTEVIGNYWEQHFELIQTFWFLRFGEGEVGRNVAWKWRKCHGVEEGDGDRNPVYYKLSSTCL